MPESPDFESIARASLHLTAGAFGTAGSHITVDDLVEQLRLVWTARGEEAALAVSQAYELGHTTGWNARGAADLATIEPLVQAWTLKDQGWHRHNGHCGVYLACAKELTEANRALQGRDR